MTRIRTVKPSMARHEDLFYAERDTGLPIRFAWAILPTICDREGRFKWRPNALKPDVLPYDNLDFARVLDVLLSRGFLVKYRVKGEWYGLIPTFKKHQHINNRELPSDLPSAEDAEETVAPGSVDTKALTTEGVLVTPASSTTSTREARDIGAERDESLAGDAPVDDESFAREPRDDDAYGTRQKPARGEGKGREGNGRSTDSLEVQRVLHASRTRRSAPHSGAEPPSPLSPVALTFPTTGVGVQHWHLTEAQVAEWARAYPGLSVLDECTRAFTWLQANPKRRKTARGMAAFLVNWLNRSTATGAGAILRGNGGNGGTPPVRTEYSPTMLARLQRAGVK